MHFITHICKYTAPILISYRSLCGLIFNFQRSQIHFDYLHWLKQYELLESPGNEIILYIKAHC